MPYYDQRSFRCQEILQNAPSLTGLSCRSNNDLTSLLFGRGGDIDAVCAILPTPFDVTTGNVDDVAVAANVEHLRREWDVRAFLTTGAYGEFTSLTDQERLDIVATVRTSCPDATIMACAGALATEASVELARRLYGAGADQVMVTAPLAVEVSEREILRHFQILADEVGHDLVVYNNAVFGHDLSIRLVEQVLGLGAFVGIKQGTRSLRALLDTVAAAERAPGVPFVLGASDLVAPLALTAGVHGISSTNCWVFPEAVIGTVDAYAHNDVGHARRLHASWSPYRAFAERMGQPATVKAAMRLRGYSSDTYVRPPLDSFDADDLDELADILRYCDEAKDKALDSVAMAAEPA